MRERKKEETYILEEFLHWFYSSSNRGYVRNDVELIVLLLRRFYSDVIDRQYRKFLVLQMAKENQFDFQNDDVDQREYYSMLTKLVETKQQKLVSHLLSPAKHSIVYFIHKCLGFSDGFLRCRCQFIISTIRHYRWFT